MRKRIVTGAAIPSGSNTDDVARRSRPCVYPLATSSSIWKAKTGVRLLINSIQHLILYEALTVDEAHLAKRLGAQAGQSQVFLDNSLTILSG